jgi:phosphoribosylaminoimidazole-succinocarboxamide synthase
MVAESILRQQLEATLDRAVFPATCGAETGKVRDWCKQGDRRVIVTTDRISAFDRILGTIPFKGQVLNQLAAYWFERTRHLAPNHVISVPDPNIMVVKECEQLPLEFVVRGYITGVTKTSAWTNYKNGVRNLCGNVLPEGLKKDQKFDTPIVTPTTKHEEHDRNVSRQEAIDEGLIDAATFDAAVALCLKLYEFGVSHAAARGLILVDTKYELGRLDGQLVVTDEVNTPDSSRYWFADSYAERFAAGEEQRKLDKEYVRTWLAEQGFVGDGPVPTLTEEVRLEAARRYIQAYESITGATFIVAEEPVATRVERVLAELC